MSRRLRSRRVIAHLAACLVAVGLAACSGGGGKAEETPNAASTQPAQGGGLVKRPEGKRDPAHVALEQELLKLGPPAAFARRQATLKYSGSEDCATECARTSITYTGPKMARRVAIRTVGEFLASVRYVESAPSAKSWDCEPGNVGACTLEIKDPHGHEFRAVTVVGKKKSAPTTLEFSLVGA